MDIHSREYFNDAVRAMAESTNLTLSKEGNLKRVGVIRNFFSDHTDVNKRIVIIFEGIKEKLSLQAQLNLLDDSDIKLFRKVAINFLTSTDKEIRSAAEEVFLLTIDDKTKDKNLKTLRSATQKDVFTISKKGLIINVKNDHKSRTPFATNSLFMEIMKSAFMHAREKLDSLAGEYSRVKEKTHEEHVFIEKAFKDLDSDLHELQKAYTSGNEETIASSRQRVDETVNSISRKFQNSFDNKKEFDKLEESIKKLSRKDDARIETKIVREILRKSLDQYIQGQKNKVEVLGKNTRLAKTDFLDLTAKFRSVTNENIRKIAESRLSVKEESKLDEHFLENLKILGSVNAEDILKYSTRGGVLYTPLFIRGDANTLLARLTVVEATFTKMLSEIREQEGKTDKSLLDHYTRILEKFANSNNATPMYQGIKRAAQLALESLKEKEPE